MGFVFPKTPQGCFGFTYDRGSWHNPWGQGGEEVWREGEERRSDGDHPGMAQKRAKMGD